MSRVIIEELNSQKFRGCVEKSGLVLVSITAKMASFFVVLFMGLSGAFIAHAAGPDHHHDDGGYIEEKRTYNDKKNYTVDGESRGRSRGRISDRLARPNRYPIDMGGDEIFDGQTIDLKQLLRDTYGRRGWKGSRIARVRVVAKSQYGAARVALVIKGDRGENGGGRRGGSNRVDSQFISGNSYDWNDNSRYTFHKVTLYNHQERMGRRWRLRFRGDRVKVRRIVVVTEGRRGGDDAPFTSIPLGTYAIEKSFFKPSYYSISVHRPGVKGFQFTCHKRSMDIYSVNMVLSDGSFVPLYDLAGFCRSGDVKTAYFDTEWVRELRVDAISTSITGSRGRLEVQGFQSFFRDLRDGPK